MSYIKTFVDISKNDIAIAGGKGASLGEMTQAGLSVPPGFVITAQAFEQFIEHSNVKQEIAAKLAAVNIEDINSVEKASVVLRDVIHDVPMPDDLVDQIVTAHKRLDAALVAVRSSATAEDSQVASWAGELETYLNVAEDDVVEKVKQCWSSLFTPRAIFYRHEKNLIDHDVQVAVVVQQMIQSEVSGICFTVHPVTEDHDQMIIEAGFGLGEAIVSGQITPDAYIVSKSGLDIVDINIGQQKKKLEMRPVSVPTTVGTAPGKNVKGVMRNDWVELDEDEGSKQKLHGKQIVELAEICKKIEVHYDFPVDIEWAYANGQFYITQSRPITTLKK